MSGPLIYLLAGEPSGDRLGAALIRGLRAEAPGVRVAGIGGREMQAAGLESLIDIADLTVMGYSEIVPRLPVILRRLREATGDVLARRPAALVTIDAPAFGLRVASRVRRADPAIRTIHYVAPTVWAWRPKRAAQMAQYVDHVLALLPFEPPYMEAAGMSCDFVGPPVAARPQADPAARPAFPATRGIPAAALLLLVAPGSRGGEVKRLMPVFGAALGQLAARHPDLTAVVPVAETVAPQVTDWAEALPLPTHLVRPEEGEAVKHVAFAAADAGIVASGTVTVELAAAGCPHVSCYRVSWLSAAIARRLIRVDTAHTINLVIGRKAVPECLQEHCTPDAVVAAADPLLAPGGGDAQRAAFAEAMALLGRDGPEPGLRAAQSVLAKL